MFSEKAYVIVLFSKKITFSLKKSPSEKVVIVEEELDGIDGIENLENLARLVLIDEECENLKVVVDGGELTRNVTKRRTQMFCKPIDVHSVTNAIGEIVSSISMWNIVNQLGKHDFSCVEIFLVGR